MRRPLVVAAGSLAVLLVVATAALAVVGEVRRDAGRSYGMHQVMGPAEPARGEQAWPRWGGDWMHGPAAATEPGYLAEMVAHHEEAVAAATELRRSERREMRAFGRSIVATQTAQIVRMKAWLAEWYPGRSTDVDYRPMMRDVTRLSGDRLDRVFLQDMIAHHMMAVMMSQRLLMRGAADHAEVRALAVSIRDDQRAEIFWMQRKLRTWFGTGWSHGMGAGPGPGMMWWSSGSSEARPGG
jgi:uncharacterized protein (DUF305 family)